MEITKIGMVGLGTVGSGVAKLLLEHGDRIARQAGRRLELAEVVVRDLQKERDVRVPAGIVSTDLNRILKHPEIKTVVHLVGGLEPARTILLDLLNAGKDVITANKAVLAEHGPELFDRARELGRSIAFDASVGGGIPIITNISQCLSANHVESLTAILNGTSNFILTEIERHHRPFQEVLAEAQQLGYAEADPTADIEGYDARSKLAILAALAFGEKITPCDIHTEGITRISPFDFQYAHKLGHTIRLLCTARLTRAGLILSVRPSLIPLSTILASVQGSYNAVWVRGAFGEDTFYYGRGAGPRPTGVAVVSDLMRVAREIRFGSPERVSPFAHERLGEYQPIPVSLQTTAFYLRFRVKDRPGIIAALSRILADKGISLDAVLQLPADNKDDLPFVITLESASEQAVAEARAQMRELDFLLEPPLALPMEKPL